MWFKKPYRNVVGLSQAKLDELLTNFEKLKDFGDDVFDRAVRYVLDDADEATLGGLACQADAADALGLQCSSESGPIADRCPWSAFLEAIESVDCRFYLRLGKLFEAAARRSGLNWASSCLAPGLIRTSSGSIAMPSVRRRSATAGSARTARARSNPMPTPKLPDARPTS
jgi:hypothetical protein